MSAMEPWLAKERKHRHIQNTSYCLKAFYLALSKLRVQLLVLKTLMLYVVTALSLQTD